MMTFNTISSAGLAIGDRRGDDLCRCTYQDPNHETATVSSTRVRDA